MDTSLWDPHSALPIFGSNICAVEKGTVMSDRDMGDMLFNFMISEEVIQFCGLDVMNVRK